MELISIDRETFRVAFDEIETVPQTWRSLLGSQPGAGRRGAAQ
ncbi:hypothetical protein [Bosea sp. F3-2]|nr:hypothetical protein [Bosea sp. F3-2]